MLEGGARISCEGLGQENDDGSGKQRQTDVKTRTKRVMQGGVEYGSGKERRVQGSLGVVTTGSQVPDPLLRRFVPWNDVLDNLYLGLGTEMGGAH